MKNECLGKRRPDEAGLPSGDIHLCSDEMRLCSDEKNLCFGDTILCIGDSLTFGYGVRRTQAWPALLAEQMKNHHILNRGVSGETTGEIARRLLRELRHGRSSLVMLMGGSNDIFFSRDAKTAKENLCMMAEWCAEKQVPVILTVPYPTNEATMAEEWRETASGAEVMAQLNQLREWLLSLDQRPGLTVVDSWRWFPEEEEKRMFYYLDGIHLSPYGHKRVAECYMDFFAEMRWMKRENA